MAGDAWIEIPDGSPFPIENLPYGVFALPNQPPRVGVAIGDCVLDLALVLGDEVFGERTLNRFLAEGPSAWSATRARLVDVLTERRREQEVRPHLHPLRGVTIHLPFEVADYVDFYSFIDHAQNVGRILRPGTEPLPANWRHLPAGYHGRAGTVVVSGTPIVRPCGQRRTDPESPPVFGPTERLDIEAEVGFVVGVGSPLGEPVPTSKFPDHVFGALLVNDWSARDIQSWEYVPLGPFLGKSFATSVSPWVVPLSALVPARVSPAQQDPPPLSYLADDDPWALDVTLEVALNNHVVSRPPFPSMYWTPGQQLAHLTVNGANLRTGDLYASGTVSGPDPSGWGSLIELTDNGRSPLHLPDGTTRGFLEDGDEVTIRATAHGDVEIGFGEVTGRIHPPIDWHRT